MSKSKDDYSNMVVQTLTKNSKGKYNIPFNMIPTDNDTFYDKDHNNGISYVTAFQHHLAIFDEEQSENNLLPFDPDKSADVERLIKAAIKVKTELIELGEKHLNIKIAEFLNGFNIKLKDGTNSYSHHSHFKQIVQYIDQNMYQNDNKSALLFLYLIRFVIVESKTWKSNAATEFHNNYSTDYLEGKAWGLFGKTTKHCIVKVFGRFSAKNVRAALDAACNAVVKKGIRLTEESPENDKAATHWEKIKLPSEITVYKVNAFTGLLEEVKLSTSTGTRKIKTHCYIRYVEGGDASPQAIGQMLFSYHKTELVKQARSIGMASSDVSRQVVQEFERVQTLLSRPQRFEGIDFAKMPSNPPACPPLPTGKPAGNQFVIDMANPDDKLAYGNGTVPSIFGGGDTNTAAKAAVDHLMAAAPPDEAAARMAIEDEAAAAAARRAKELADQNARNHTRVQKLFDLQQCLGEKSRVGGYSAEVLLVEELPI